MYLVFDTETNGKIKDFNVKMSKVDNFPRVTQLSFALYGEDEKIRRKYNFLIKPDGWTIPDEEFFRNNGMNTERNILNGIPIFQALDTFLLEVQNAQYLIAHNIKFDHPVLGAEMIRFGLGTSRILPKICTMLSSANFCKLPRNKWPKLEELYRILFKEELSDAHDALGDVMSTARCFFELKRLGVINLDSYDK